MILGITGGFGCGKSTVLHYFATHAWRTFDADEVCHLLYSERAQELMAVVRNQFGADVFDADGSVDRKKLGAAVFRAPEKMPYLTQTLYPLLHKKMMNLIVECKRDGISGAFELPLLYEAGFADAFDAILAIWTAPDLRRQRLHGRGFDDDAIARRDRMQMPPEEKLERADFAVVNNGVPAQLALQLDQLVGGPRPMNSRATHSYLV